jgi:hypothetical protein
MIILYKWYEYLRIQLTLILHFYFKITICNDSFQCSKTAPYFKGDKCQYFHNTAHRPTDRPTNQLANKQTKHLLSKILLKVGELTEENFPACNEISEMATLFPVVCWKQRFQPSNRDVLIYVNTGWHKNLTNVLATKHQNLPHHWNGVCSGARKAKKHAVTGDVEHIM